MARVNVGANVWAALSTFLAGVAGNAQQAKNFADPTDAQDLATKVYVDTAVSGGYMGSGTSSISLDAGQTVNVQVTVTGAIIGKPVRIGMTNWSIDMFATAFVSASNTVTINVLNMTGGAFAESVTFTATVDT